MNLRTFLSTFLFLILLLASCNEKEEKQHALPAPMEEIDTTSMKKSLLREIKNYVNEHQDGRVFTLFPIEEYKIRKDINDWYNAINNEVFYIAKTCQDDFGKNNLRWRCYPHKYIDINGKYIFIPSLDDAFFNQDELKIIFNRLAPIAVEVRDGHHFLLYDKEDSCEVLERDYFEGDSIFRYELREIIKLGIEEVKSHHKP